MLTRLLRWIGVDLAEWDVVIVPTEQWHRVFERVRAAEARVVDLERQLAAMEQGSDHGIDAEWLKVWDIVRDLRAGGMPMSAIEQHLSDHGVKLPRLT